MGGKVQGGKVEGEIIQVRASGDLVTNISVAQLEEAPRDDQVRISCGGHVTAGIYPADHSEPEMTFLAVIGPQTDCIELCLVGESASNFLGIREGSAVTVQW